MIGTENNIPPNYANWQRGSLSALAALLFAGLVTFWLGMLAGHALQAHYSHGSLALDATLSGM